MDRSEGARRTGDHGAIGAKSEDSPVEVGAQGIRSRQRCQIQGVGRDVAPGQRRECRIQADLDEVGVGSGDLGPVERRGGCGHGRGLGGRESPSLDGAKDSIDGRLHFHGGAEDGEPRKSIDSAEPVGHAGFEDLMLPGIVGAGFVVVVDDVCVFDDHQTKSEMTNSLGPVRVLEVHEHAFVQRADLVEDGSPNHETGADNGVDVDVVFATPDLAIGAMKLAQGSPAPKEVGTGAEDCDRTQGRQRGQLEGLVIIEPGACAHGAGIGMLVQILNHAVEGPGEHVGVGIQEDVVAARGDGDGLVVCARETHIVVVGDQLDLGKLAAHHVDRAIFGGVVDHDDFHRDRLHAVQDALDTFFQEGPCVPVYERHGQVGHWGSRNSQ